MTYVGRLREMAMLGKSNITTPRMPSTLSKTNLELLLSRALLRCLKLKSTISAHSDVPNRLSVLDHHGNDGHVPHMISNINTF